MDAQAAVELGDACLGAGPASVSKARRAQLVSAVAEVAAELESRRSTVMASSAISAASSGVQSSPAQPPASPDICNREGSVPQGEEVGGWAARRAAAAAQQQESLLLRRRTGQSSPERQQEQQQEQTPPRAVSNGHLHGPRSGPEQQLGQSTTAAPALQVGSHSASPSQLSDSVSSHRPRSTAANGAAVERGVAAYSMLELRKLRVACADVCRRFDASSLDQDVRKPPAMVPPMPPPAEDPPAD